MPTRQEMGMTKEQRRPPELKAFMRILASEGIDITDSQPTLRKGLHCWLVTATDPDVGALTIRYTKYAHHAGLELYELKSSPPRNESVSIAIIVGPPPEESA
jgi:hypothetical protein